MTNRAVGFGSPNWLPVRTFAGHQIGICPGLNAVVLLNEQAAVVWDAIARGDTAETAAGHLADAGGMTRAAAANHVTTLVRAWESAALFDHRPPDAPDPGDETVPSGVVSVEKTVRGPAGSACLRVLDAPQIGSLVDALLCGLPTAAPASNRLTTMTIWAMADGRYAYGIDGTAFDARLTAAELRSAVNMLLFDKVLGLPRTARVHGACVAFGALTVVLMGVSGAGKSTLAGALSARGWTQLSDDTVPLDSALRAHPVPLPASIKDGSLAVLSKAKPALSQLPRHMLAGRSMRFVPLDEPKEALAPRAPTHAIAVRYAPHETARLEPIDNLERLSLFLGAETFIDFEAGTFPKVLKWMETIPTLKLTYSDFDDAARLLQGLHRVAT